MSSFFMLFIFRWYLLMYKNLMWFEFNLNFFHIGRYLYIKNYIKTMAKEKSLVEEAIIQMKNLEEAVAENAKGILASTMKQEIKDLVKESLSEQDDEIEIDDVEMEDPMGSDDIADMDMGDDSDEEGDEMDTDDMDDTEDDGDDEEEEDMDFDDEEDMDDDEDTIDLTDADDEEVLRVFQLMGPDDNIVVTKDDKGNTHLKDEETGKEYMIVGEGEEETYEEWSEEVDEMWGGNEHDFKRRDGHKIGDVDGHYKDFELDEDDMGMNGETIEDIVDRMFSDSEDGDEIYADEVDFDLDEELMYEIEMDEDDSEEYIDMEEDVDDSVMESKKMSIKGVGFGNPNKKKVYSNKPNQEGGFKTKMKQGPRTMGTGKAKFDYKDGENAGSKLGNNKMVKKVESKEESKNLL